MHQLKETIGWTQLAFIEGDDAAADALWLQVDQPIQCMMLLIWNSKLPMRLEMIVISCLSQFCVEDPYSQKLGWIVTMGLGISELWPFTRAPPEAVFNKSASALAFFIFSFF